MTRSSYFHLKVILILNNNSTILDTDTAVAIQDLLNFSYH